LRHTFPNSAAAQEPFALIAADRVLRPVSQHAVDALFAAHTYLCRRGARKFYRSGLERSDLEQVAAVGLVKAARRYDGALETPFEAYAWLTIVGELMHHVRDHERPIRLPRRLQTLERPYQRARERLMTALGREPSDGELGEELGVLAATVRELRRAVADLVPVEIDATGGVDPALEDPVGLADRLALNSASAALTPLERAVVIGVYHLGLTQHEIALRLGLPPKRVSRLHRAALESLRSRYVA